MEKKPAYNQKLYLLFKSREQNPDDHWIDENGNPWIDENNEPWID